jgi:superfamily II DNA/RNA helicase
MPEATKLASNRKRKRKQRESAAGDQTIEEERAQGPRARKQYKGFAAVEAPEVTTVTPEQASSVTHEIRDFTTDDKQADLVKFVQEVQANEQRQRQKTKFLIYVKKRQGGTFLANALSTKSKKKMMKKTDEGSQLQRSMLKTTFESKGALFIHGKTYTEQIDYAVHCFRSGKLRVLMVTDEVAHAVYDQIKTIGCVINFDLPPTIEEYRKRLDYCGKAGGTVLSYYSATEACRSVVPGLRDFLKVCGQHQAERNKWLEHVNLDAAPAIPAAATVPYCKGPANVRIKPKKEVEGRRHINGMKKAAIRITVKNKRAMIKANKAGKFNIKAGNNFSHAM